MGWLAGLLLATGVARAEPSVDWAAGAVEVEARAESAGLTGWQPLEQRARNRADDLLRGVLAGLPAGEGRTGEDLLEGRWPEGVDDVLSRWLTGGRGGWRVVEARYHRSGDVEIVARLELAAWLAPAIRPLAGGPAPREAAGGEPTGVVVDARGTGVEPALLGRLLAPDGTVIYDLAALHPGTLDARLPVAWVTDPADPEAFERAGERPIFVAGAEGEWPGDVVLDAAGAGRVADRVVPEVAWSPAAVVVVVDP